MASNPQNKWKTSNNPSIKKTSENKEQKTHHVRRTEMELLQSDILGTSHGSQKEQGNRIRNKSPKKSVTPSDALPQRSTYVKRKERDPVTPNTTGNKSATASPETHKGRWDDGNNHSTPSDMEDDSDDPITQIQASKTSPASEELMKEMMLSLRKSIKKDLNDAITKISDRLDTLEERVTEIDERIEEVAFNHNGLTDKVISLQEEISAMKIKMADMEDRGRRNNVKIRGVPETVKDADLKKYVQHLIATLIPTVDTIELTVDRAQRLYKPKHLPEEIPRDVITRIHYFHVKEQLLAECRKLQKTTRTIPAPVSIHRPLPIPSYPTSGGSQLKSY
ncbi:uncharacterized protein LOC130291701 [Hyla sarda]|uniref:uncharacterized protein LOC130291701 n=1 Tax=Hyla sarda TaxID=327740 RepID=UPI0024C4007F|nr:uncharacterized protein LOC130291701 [Hyla sarda]